MGSGIGTLFWKTFVIVFPTDARRLDVNFTAVDVLALEHLRPPRVCVLLRLVCSSEEIKLILCDSHF